jgi:positive regulator of sigma E activity
MQVLKLLVTSILFAYLFAGLFYLAVVGYVAGMALYHSLRRRYERKKAL